ncbi:hypothetical protein F0562_002781 [Nyssa sinensis]|uniref:Protein kinase domain-containing protein n=1 Tax=Nyssa sinensis TaxID=561372 RepID=A0A5J5BWL5_9ASTE|nr:hypothetical protein F0562_002781 [Nyssa sinensis]
MVSIPGEREAMSTLHKLAVLLLPLLVVMLAARLGTAQPESKSEPEPNCPRKCGELNIPYPFGTREGCYLNDSFLITCNDTENIPYLRRGNLRVMNISFDGELEVLNQVAYVCYDKSGEIVDGLTYSLQGTSRFPISYTRNKFTVVGCDTYGIITGSAGYQASCTALCDDTQYLTNGSCSGIGCCQTTIPKRVTDFNLSTGSFDNRYRVWDFSPCDFAFVVKEEVYNFSTAHLSNLSNIRELPVVLNWAIGNQTCEEAKINVNNTYVCGKNTECYNSTNRLGYLCKCIAGYEGNPYLENGCQDIDECKISNSCNRTCHNLPGSYNCSCPEGYEGDGRINGTGCSLINVPNKKFPFINIALGISVGLTVILLLIAFILVGVQKRNITKVRANFFRKNGGIMLQNLLSRSENSVQTTKIFREEELKKATYNFNDMLVVGEGGFGTVYKGTLADNKIVAIKKSKLVDPSQIEQFVTEVKILSQIKHPNVVKLLGCCLETPVPLLVYEFITNKTLFHHLHDESRVSSIPWELRLRIATETADALAHMHSTTQIIHRDIKSANILLNDDYTAKVSDFGISKLVPSGKTHLTTLVQGTYGYIDPEHFESGNLTEKSDVYSFGVILVELLTGQQVLSSERTEKNRSLARYFTSSLEEDCFFHILEDRVKQEGNVEQLKGVAEIAKKCLKMKGGKRPTMEEVKQELEALSELEGHTLVEIQIEEREPLLGEPLAYYDDTASSGLDSMRNLAAFQINSGGR